MPEKRDIDPWEEIYKQRDYMAGVRDDLLKEIGELRTLIGKLFSKYDEMSKRISEAEAHDLVMEERVSTLIKFVDRLATVVYTSAGGLFITIVGSAILTKGS